MITDAESRKTELLAKPETAWPIFQAEHDPRITRVGRFLRKTSLDEFPQFINPGQGLSAMQRAWLTFCFTEILVTHAVCRVRFARLSLSAYALAALSWMFRHARMPCQTVLKPSTGLALFNPTE